MAELTAKTAQRAANAVTVSAATETGDTFVNTGKEAIYLINASASPVTVSVETTATIDGVAAGAKEIVVPAGTTHLLGPWPKALYNDGDNLVSITYSAHEDVSLAILKVA